MIKPGKYRHYKGGVYVVLFTADDVFAGKPVVVYMNEAHGTYYTRPLKEFIAKVDIDEGVSIPRFQLIDKV